MQVGQKSFAHLMSKLVAQAASRSARKPTSSGLRELHAEQLRHVSGGSSQSQSPKGTW
jgi:hypothetical protein